MATLSHAQVLGDPVKAAAQGLFTKPNTDLQTVALIPRGREFVLKRDPQAGKVKWTIKVQSLAR